MGSALPALAADRAVESQGEGCGTALANPSADAAVTNRHEGNDSALTTPAVGVAGTSRHGFDSARSIPAQEDGEKLPDEEAGEVLDVVLDTGAGRVSLISALVSAHGKQV